MIDCVSHGHLCLLPEAWLCFLALLPFLWPVAAAPLSASKPVCCFLNPLPGTRDHCPITRFNSTIYWKSTPQALSFISPKDVAVTACSCFSCICVWARVRALVSFPVHFFFQLTSAELSLALVHDLASAACKWIFLTDVWGLCFTCGINCVTFGCFSELQWSNRGQVWHAAL